jgi:uncharacterized protein (TIGR00369 family)
VEGRVAPPPIHHLTGLVAIGTQAEASTWAMPASPWWQCAVGFFSGGAIAYLADGAPRGAITTTLPPRTCFATLDMKVDFLRPVTPDGRDLVARATVARRGRTIAVATATIDDADGKTVAMANASAVLLPDRPWISVVPGALVDES